MIKTQGCLQWELQELQGWFSVMRCCCGTYNVSPVEDKETNDKEFYFCSGCGKNLEDV